MRFEEEWVEVEESFDFDQEAGRSLKENDCEVIRPVWRSRTSPDEILMCLQHKVIERGESMHVGEEPWWDAHLAAAAVLENIQQVVWLLKQSDRGVEFLEKNGWGPWYRHV